MVCRLSHSLPVPSAALPARIKVSGEFVPGIAVPGRLSVAAESFEVKPQLLIRWCFHALKYEAGSRQCGPKKLRMWSHR